MNRRTVRPTLEILENREVPAIFVVAPGGSNANLGSVEAPFATIQHALNVAARPGDIVRVRGGVYREKIVMPASGTAEAPITLESFPGERAVLSGKGVRGANMILLQNVSFVRIQGLEITDNRNVRDGSGIRLVGASTGVELRGNVIHDMRGRDAMGITVYGTSTDAPISKLVVDGNVIYRCDPARSEALTLNGNVTDFVVSNNLVRDVNNIGIDIIGGEGAINPVFGARNGVVRGNTVIRARSDYDGGFGAGIYVDGGKDIVVENNTVTQCDLGIEVGAENPGVVATNVTVRNNLIFRNDKGGLVFGGFKANRGRANNCTFQHNVVWKNDTQDDGQGQLWIQFAEGNTVTNNIFVAGPNNVLLHSDNGNVSNTLDNNVWFTNGGPEDANFTVNGREFGSFFGYRGATGQDANSVFADPGFAAPKAGDFHVGPGSPAVNMGATTTALDREGRPRPINARPDAGAYEVA